MIRFVAYVWLGLILGVSFLATPIKFQAESLTLPVALDVGRTTFHAFGKVEWVLTFILGLLALRSRGEFEPADWFLVAMVTAIVLAQAGLLIPRLDVRVAAIIAGDTPPPSHLHTIYAGAEFAKALALLFIGLWTADHLST